MAFTTTLKSQLTRTKGSRTATCQKPRQTCGQHSESEVSSIRSVLKATKLLQ